MKLSDLNSGDVERVDGPANASDAMRDAVGGTTLPEETAAPAIPAPMKLSDLSPDDVQPEAPAPGVWDKIKGAYNSVQNAANDSDNQSFEMAQKVGVSPDQWKTANQMGSTPAVQGIAGAISGAADKFLESPIPKNVADATDVAGKGHGLVAKVWNAIKSSQPTTPAAVLQESAPAADNITSAAVRMFGKGAAHGVASAAPEAAAEIAPEAGRGVMSHIMDRAVTYGAPGPLKYAQAFSDTARGVQGMQHGINWAMENAPEKLGPFLGGLKKAAASGAASLATYHFLLQQKSPEFQEIEKNMRENQ